LNIGSPLPSGEGLTYSYNAYVAQKHKIDLGHVPAFGYFIVHFGM